MLNESIRETLRPIGLLLVRVVAGATMIYGHGWGKFQKFISGDWTFADPIGLGEGVSLGLAAGAEFGAALLVVLGLATRISALPLVITMLVAALIFHAGDPFGDKELPLIYATIFLSLFFTGPGEYSLDYRFGLEE
jgi:putative oxidoreductase